MSTVSSTDWDARYAGAELVWGAGPNRFVVREFTGRPPGRALDLAAGEGRNALWLAEQGWHVLAVDFSAVAIERAHRLAAERGLEVSWVVADVLSAGLPDRAFDAVLVAYLHLPAPDRAAVLARAAAALAPGGTLLVVGHAPSAEHHHHDLPAPEQVVAELALPEDEWELRACELRERLHAFRDEPAKARIDTVVRFRRR